MRLLTSIYTSLPGLFGLLLFLNCRSVTAQSPPYVVRNFEWKHGLSDRLVTGFVFDERGLGWLGNSDGLHLYDGLNLYPAAAFPGDSSALLEKQVWFLTYDSLSHRTLVMAAANDSISMLYAIKSDAEKGLQLQTLGTWKGGVQPDFDYSGGRLSFLLNGYLHIVFLNERGIIAQQPRSLAASSLLRLRTGGVCVLNDAGIVYQITGNNSKQLRIKKTHQIPASLVRQIRFDRSHIPDPVLRRLVGQPFEKLSNLIPGLLVKERAAAFGSVERPDGTHYLFGSLGVQQVSQRPAWIRSIPYPSDLRTIALRDSIRGYIGSNRGILPFDIARGTIGKPLLNLHDYYCVGVPIRKNRFLYFPLYGGTPPILIDLQTGLVRGIRINRQDFSIVSAYLCADSASFILGSSKGAWTARLLGDSLIQVSGKIAGLEGSVEALETVKDRRGQSVLLAGSYSGLYVVDPVRGKASRILEHEVLCICDLPEGIMIGTKNKGVIFLDKQLKPTRSFRIQDGLAGNTAYSMAYDAQHKSVWIGCSEGVSLYHLSSGIHLNLYQEDGLAGNEQNRTSIRLLDNGKRILMGGIAGISVISREQLFDRLRSIPNQIIWAYEQTNREGTKTLHFYNEQNPPEFNADISSISWKYFHDPAENALSAIVYQLDEGKQSTVAPDQDLNLSELSHGWHSLRTFRLHPTGKLQPLQTVRFKISPIWYQTQGAKLTAVLTLLALTVLIFLVREKLITRRLKNRAQRDKTRLFSIIAHDLRSPMKAYNGLADILKYQLEKQNWESIKIVSRHIDEVGRSMDLLLDNLLNWSLGELDELKIEKQDIELPDSLEQILPVYQSIADQKSVRLRTIIESVVPAFTDKNILDLILRNLLDNALKNAPPDSEVIIHCCSESDHILIEVGNEIVPEALAPLQEISDNLTQPENIPGRGLGIQFITRSVNILKGSASLTIQSVPPLRVQWSIVLPQLKN